MQLTPMGPLRFTGYINGRVKDKRLQNKLEDLKPGAYLRHGAYIFSKGLDGRLSKEPIVARDEAWPKAPKG